jgi:ABC-2 type transport system ATP-binding protein
VSLVSCDIAAGADCREAGVPDVIRCQGLGKRYGSTVAVDSLDLAVEAGQVFGFLGRNGAGKTTTMRMLLGLIRPTAGQAWLNGRQVPDPGGLASVGSMIEEPAFYPWMTGRRNLEVLALCGPPLPAGKDQITAVLDRVGLSAVAGRKVKAYSQGMRQRLGLAAALLRDPAVLLLDEPSNGMDPAGMKEFRTLLRSLADGGATVFLSSHLLAEVAQVCDEIAVLDSGRLVEQGRVADLTSARTRVRVVVSARDQPAAQVLLNRWPLLARGPDELVVETASGREVNEALGRGGVWAHQVLVEHPGLEETFLRLTETTIEEVHRAPAPR